MNFFDVIQQSKHSQARLGTLQTQHGVVTTPCFMPIATKAAIKSLTIAEMQQLGAQIILSNTYHLYLRPGADVLQPAGGLHQFMKWPGPILTDSGGFQVFSLGGTKHRGENLVTITADGVIFKSHIDGSTHTFTPESVLQMQRVIGSDIMMILDVCTPYPATYEIAAADVQRTTEWAIRAKTEYEQGDYAGQHCFAIVQGSTYTDLRLQSADQLKALDFCGYAIGGLAVGETHEQMYAILDELTPVLPETKPRYLMGVGKPENIVEAVVRGVDMFDCVIPTREARHGRLYCWTDEPISIDSTNWYTTVSISNKRFAQIHEPLQPDSELAVLREYTFAYLHHLFKTNEPLALRLATLSNLSFYLEMMRRIQQQIATNQW